MGRDGAGEAGKEMSLFADQPATYKSLLAVCSRLGVFIIVVLVFRVFFLFFWGGIFVAEGEALQWDSSSVTIELQ